MNQIHEFHIPKIENSMVDTLKIFWHSPKNLGEKIRVIKEYYIPEAVTMGGGGGVGVSGSMVSRKQPEDVERVRFRMAWLYEFGIRNLEGVLVPE